jgi:histidinol dehydrogenase
MRFGAVIDARDENEGIDVCNRLAPEHLEIDTADPRKTFSRIENAGAAFLGRHTPVAIGDYFAGPSHTLPTGGAARFIGGLSANDFLKRTSVIEYSAAALAAAAGDVERMARIEGLVAHWESVEVRLNRRNL